MPQKDKLETYRHKRDFTKTSEPSGSPDQPSDKSTSKERPHFVIQKHQSRTLHYDLRLEVVGVLKSWAVPKGPSVDPKVKRLAVPTEDHPLEYLDFEGVIPEGEYGAGTVIVWDIGAYQNLTQKEGLEVPMAEALEKGHASFLLEGKKLRGGFALTRTGKGKQERWILVKMNDDEAEPGVDLLVEKPDSALSGRSMEEVAKED
jgi:DNA ligase D-like protein (predicted 3'-phosphoesterase)